MRKIKIVCIIGLVSESVEMFMKLMELGMNVVWLNFFYGDFEEYGVRIKNICEVSKKFGKNVGILLDIKGFEICIYIMENGGIEFEIGKEFIVLMDEVVGIIDKILVIYEGLVDDVEKGLMILLDDGFIGFEVLNVDVVKCEIKIKVLNNGIFKNKKGVNVLGVSVNFLGIIEKDVWDIVFGIE